MSARVILLLTFSLFQLSSFAQKGNIWITHSESQFLHSPGIEGNYFFNKHIGIQLGTSLYFRDIDNDRIANISKFNDVNLYSLNVNACTYLFHNDKHSFGFTAGVKIHNGPNYELLFENENYHIYFDAAAYRAEFSMDLGLTYRFKKITTLFKFDTVRQDFTFGLGYAFGNLNKPIDLP